ncbi:hypothetical protein RUM44_005876 [Polyplax serrata]|uniref:LAGLIDADG homing endonuclease n=1 Tax=Polyplax serrata TaxID=468196 RepID=A0ABR1AYY0_POLSC
MDDRTIDLIFAGSLESLPPVSSKIVRIFTSSTFTGTFDMETCRPTPDIFYEWLLSFYRHDNGKKHINGPVLPPTEGLLQRKTWTGISVVGNENNIVKLVRKSTRVVSSTMSWFRRLSALNEYPGYQVQVSGTLPELKKKL